MRKYEKPSIQVIELQLKENIAAAPKTTIHVDSTGTGNTNASAQAFNLALSQANIGFMPSEEAGFTS